MKETRFFLMKGVTLPNSLRLPVVARAIQPKNLEKRNQVFPDEGGDFAKQLAIVCNKSCNSTKKPGFWDCRQLEEKKPGFS